MVALAKGATMNGQAMTTDRERGRTERQQQAVQSAGEKLDRLELAMRRCFYAGLATAVSTGLLAVVALYGAWQYHRITSSLAQIQASAGRDLADFQRQLKSGLPGGGR